MPTQFKIRKCLLPLLVIIALLFPCGAYALSPAALDFSGAAVIEMNRNVPAFLPAEIAAEDFVSYSELDALGRAGQAIACVSRSALPTELRADSDELLPVGWMRTRYDGVIDGRWLYNVCHVISPALSGSGSDPRNIFTGTRCLHTEGMRLFEERIIDYITRTANHVMYRVTPVYRDNNLLPTGVQMEAYSVEDAGRTISFNVFLYNIQPGIAIDYRDGNSRLDETVELTFSAAQFLRSQDLPAPSEMVPPEVGSFIALYDKQMKKTSTTSQVPPQAQPQTQAQPQQQTQPQPQTQTQQQAQSQQQAQPQQQAQTQTQQQEQAQQQTQPAQSNRIVYIPQTDVGIYHLTPRCSSVDGELLRRMTEDVAIASGYSRCTGDCAQYS